MSTSGSASTLLAGMVGPEGPLSSSQREMARRIVETFLSEGYPAPLAAAAVVNAYAESKLRPNVWGDKKHDPEGIGCSGGLFQLNRCGGAGMGYTRSQVLDPATNISVILKEIRGHFGKPVREALARGESRVVPLTGLLTRHVLRPGDLDKKVQQRQQMSLVMFPFLAGRAGQ